jgi:hypothetical protein
VGANTALEYGVAVVQQVVSGDRRRGERARALDVLRRLAGGDVLKNDFQTRKVATQGDQMLINKCGLAVKQVNITVRDFTVHQQRHAGALHGFQRGIGFAQISDPRIAIGGRTRRIELHGRHTGVFGACNFVRRQVIGQVQGHQRLKGDAGGHRSQDAPTVGLGLGGAGDRWFQVGHDHGAPKLGGGVGHHGGERLTIAQMHVPVVGSGQGQGVGRGGHSMKKVDGRWL